MGGVAIHANPVAGLQRVPVPAGASHQCRCATFAHPLRYGTVLVRAVEVHDDVRIPEAEPGYDALDMDLGIRLERRLERMMGMGRSA